MTRRRVEGPDPRLAILYRSEAPAERAWSGVPAGLARGLAAHDHAAALVAAELGAGSRRALWAARRLRLPFDEHGRAAVALRSASARARLARTSASHCVVLGTDFEPGNRPFATLEDMTVRQAACGPLGHYQRLTAGELARWVARQGLIYGRARSCCAASAWTAASIASEYGIDPGKVHVVGFGRNLDPRPGRTDWSRPRFLFVGRPWDRKNGDAVVRAFASVRERVPDAELHLVGETPRLDVPGVVQHGMLQRGDARYVTLFERATCLLQPSIVEPFGIAYVEAAAAGTPSIGTTVGGAATAIGDGGVLVDPGDGAALVRAMQRLTVPDEAARLGAAALRRAPLFTWPQVAGRVLRALDLPHDPALAQPL